MNSDTGNDYQAVIDSPIPGVPSLGLKLSQGYLIGIDFLTRWRRESVTEEANAGVNLLRDYFAGRTVKYPPLLRPGGTDFQLSVWQALQQIPYGSVCTYGELASRLGTSARAVAGACRANPLPLLIPCHRVVAANGPGGYMGSVSAAPVETKLWLLQHEGYV
jgi:methylated-DNA-[protein]-cysteine S-methyltransferase